MKKVAFIICSLILLISCNNEDIDRDNKLPFYGMNNTYWGENNANIQFSDNGAILTMQLYDYDKNNTTTQYFIVADYTYDYKESQSKDRYGNITMTCKKAILKYSDFIEEIEGEEDITEQQARNMDALGYVYEHIGSVSGKHSIWLYLTMPFFPEPIEFMKSNKPQI